MSSWHEHIGRETNAKARLEPELVARFSATLGDAGVTVDPAAPPAGLPDAEAPAADEDWILPDSRLLFRYSALTFNSHRIHYDLPYARDEENYPALVVHGPLQATLLAARAAQALGRPLHRFRYRGQAPAFAGRPLSFVAEPDAGGGVTVTSRQFGKICMQAQAA